MENECRPGSSGGYSSGEPKLGRTVYYMNQPTPESDADLLRKIKNGDSAAARILVDQNLDRIVNYGYRMLGDRVEEIGRAHV